MSSTKRQWEEEIYDSQQTKQLAKYLGVAEEALGEVEWEINVDDSKEGMIYGYFVNFLGEIPSHLQEVLEEHGLEHGTLYLESSYADDDYYDDYEDELFWDRESERHFDIFRETAGNIENLSKNSVDEELRFSYQVMLFMHAVAAIERLLQSVFLHKVTSSEEYTRKFVEYDEKLAKRELKLGNLFKTQDTIRTIVQKRIDQILFHNVKFVAGLYVKVFGLQFGDVSWLTEAVKKRHDCAHRAGYDKEGNRIEIKDGEILSLVEQCRELANRIESHFLPPSFTSFPISSEES